MIDVVHDIDKLSCRAKLYVNNVRLAYERLQYFMESKRPRGMRLRHSIDIPQSLILLEARNTLPIEAAISMLRESGFIRRTK
jgi:hypothetical protein